MKFLKSIIKIGFSSNIAVFFAMMLLPAFLVTDQLDLFEKILSYFVEL